MTRWAFTVHCQECRDTFNCPKVPDPCICDWCKRPQPVHVERGHGSVGYGAWDDDMSFHRVFRLIEDDATDHDHLDHISEAPSNGQSRCP